jgi:DNA-binding protein YbaB
MTTLCGMTITWAVFFCRIVKFPVAKRRRRDVFIDGAEEATIGQYANYGPNNEVYLAQGQAISFKLTGNTNEIASIQIGAKAPNGAATMVVEGKVSTTTRLEQQLNTATEMYYNITEQAKDGQLVTISNTGNGILSLTNLKITYKTSGQTVTLSDLTAEEQANAVAMVQALFAAPVETFQPERFDASWGGSVRAGRKATLTVKASEDVDAITVDSVTVSSYTTRTERTGWGWWSPKVTYRVFTYTATAPAQTTDYAVCAVNAEGTASEPITATLTVRPATWWNWWF